MISVIVPVYNVEPYLVQCLDSILAQTYRDIEIILVDDGSTDGCPQICDAYREKDNRVVVFHTENRGLSAARNLGLDHAHGEYIGFVDSDDWIEPRMYETLYKKARETGADIVCCAYFREESGKTTVGQAVDAAYHGKEALQALVQGNVNNTVWNKLWKSRLFESEVFPVGRNYEDIALGYKLLEKASLFVCIQAPLYHYLCREDSISKDYRIPNLIDYWDAYHQRYMYLETKKLLEPEFLKQEQRKCLSAAMCLWAWYIKDDQDAQRCCQEKLTEISGFIRETVYPALKHERSVYIQVCLLLTRKPGRPVFYIAYLLKQVYPLYSRVRKILSYAHT